MHRTTTTQLGTFYHRHEAYEIYLFLRGNVHFYVEDGCYHLKPGDLIAIRPDEMHRARVLDSSEYERITINLQRSYLDRLSSPATSLSDCFDNRRKGLHPIVRLNEEQLNRLRKLTDALESHLNSDAYGADIMVNSYMAQILVFMNTVFRDAHFVHTNIMPDVLRNLIRYIDEHLTESISLTQLSPAFYLNGTYISRLFKQHTGLTLRHYLLNRRIHLAKRLLDQGHSVTEACYMSGFNDYANFIRSFTKVSGISPGKYAKGKKRP